MPFACFENVKCSTLTLIAPLCLFQCKTVADEINGKTPGEIRARFNIENDLTKEEEAEIIRGNVWCDEH